jgi:hypothetical protein
VGRRLAGVLAVLNQGLGEDTGLIIGTDEVTVDNDRQVEVTGRGDTVTCSVTPNALLRRCSHVESRRAKCSYSPAVWPESGLGETTTCPAPYANWYANQPDSGGVRGCTPMYVKRSDLQKLDTHEQRRTPCLNLGVKWSQVQILSAQPRKMRSGLLRCDGCQHEITRSSGSFGDHKCRESRSPAFVTEVRSGCRYRPDMDRWYRRCPRRAPPTVNLGAGGDYGYDEARDIGAS